MKRGSIKEKEACRMKNYRIGILEALCLALAACSSAEKNAEAETVHPISILAGENSFSEWDESGEQLLASVSYPVVILAEQETYPELTETLALIQNEREEACRFAYEAMGIRAAGAYCVSGTVCISGRTDVSLWKRWKNNSFY